MAAVQRFDVGRLNRAQRTGAGGARVPGSVSRTGVQTYTDSQGRTIREYRPPEEVFSPESLATLASVPVTVGHPAGGVTPSNYREVTRGHASDAPPARRADGPVEWVDHALIVSDGDTLRRVDTGELEELSAGYLADVVPEKGVSPDGQHYDAKQTNIRFNHIALLPAGHARAGSGAKLRLDGNQEPTMTVRHDDNSSPAPAPKQLVKVDGIDVEKGSDTHLSLLERAITSEKKRADDATTALTAAQTELGAAKATIASHKPVDVSALVQDELDFRTRMLPALPKQADGKAYDFTGKTREAVRADAVGPAVVAEAAKLPEGERGGFITAHVKMKLDAAGKVLPTLHTPTVVVDSSDPTKKKPADKRADAFNASFGTPAAAK